jgi:hypothetical protein
MTDYCQNRVSISRLFYRANIFAVDAFVDQWYYSLSNHERSRNMNQLEVLQAPTIPTLPDNKWEREKRAFHQMLPTLLHTHNGQYVAIHEGEVVETGQDKLAVAGCAYARFGYVPIFVSLVTNLPPSIVRVPSPRSIRLETEG